MLTRKAALAYVGERPQSAARIAVFGIDLSLLTYQTYTREAELLRKAIEDVGVRSTAQFESHAGKARELAQQSDGAGVSMSALQAGGPGRRRGAGRRRRPWRGGRDVRSDAAAHARDLRDARADQQGLTSVNALLAVVNSMRGLPGRKSVIFFSEGVAIPANVAARFHPSSIRPIARTSASMRWMQSVARGEHHPKTARQRQRRCRTHAPAKPDGRRRRRADDRSPGAQRRHILRRDPHSGLGQLSDETGGVLIGNTNDLTGGLKRIDQDMRNYYMLSYVPKNDKFDGKFRPIAVKVKRGGVDVASRKGYYAVRSAGPDAGHVLRSASAGAARHDAAAECVSHAGRGTEVSRLQRPGADPRPRVGACLGDDFRDIRRSGFVPGRIHHPRSDPQCEQPGRRQDEPVLRADRTHGAARIGEANAMSCSTASAS